jgi:signal transduction histidine kinase/DNA-binding response OmpR family regulator/CHASE3 domain sensor protein
VNRPSSLDPALRPFAPGLLPPRMLLGFVLALIAVLTLAVFSWRSLQERSDSSARVKHSTAVLAGVEKVLSTTKDLETGQRGFLLTGQEQFLEPYNAANAELPTQFSALRRLVRDDPAQAARIDAMQREVDNFHQLMEARIKVRRELGAENSFALTTAQALRTKQMMDRVRLQAQEIEQVQGQRMMLDEAQWETAARNSFTVQLVGVTALVLLIALATLVAGREHRSREAEAWLRQGQALLAERLQGDPRLEALGESVLDFLVQATGAVRGTAYAIEADRLERFGAWAADDAPPTLQRGEGLTGQAVASARPMHVTQVPAGYLPVDSSLGAAAPRELLLAPARVAGRTYAVFELAYFRRIGAAELALVERTSEQLGMAVRSARDRSRLEALLEETQRQSEELQTQQEELRVTNEELEEQGRLLRQSQAQLETQQLDLEQSNAQLEEQARQLEAQRDDLERSSGELVQRGAELERANQYKSEFLANMSHELRTPLNSTLILAKLLGDNPQGNLSEEQVRYARTIAGAGNDLLALINDILDLSKIESGKVELQIEDVETAAIVEDLAAIFQPQAKEKGLAFHFDVEPGAPARLRSDRQRLGQVLKNLLSNALKFTARGEVTLQVRGVGADQVAFSVRDTGIGMPEQQHEVIFEAFRQADGSTHRRYGGTGLGLSISRDLARLLGGDISVSSREGEGSVFTLLLPVDSGAQAPAPARKPASVAPAPRAVNGAALASAPASAPAPLAAPQIADDRDAPSGGRLILVIEDDVAFAAILRDLSREMGFQCVISHSAADGLAAAAHYLPSAILLDMKLPDHSGLGVLDQLKRNPATRHIPVHAVSVSDYSREAMELGAVGYAIKPVPRDELVRVLKKLEAKSNQELRRVLVIEDDARQREAMVALLSNGNTQITAVATAGEALAQIGAGGFDCIVMDLALPDLSGYELLEKMAAQEDGAYPPVIVYTGRTLSREEEQKLQRFSRSIILKGVRSPERLLDEVTLFLHQVEAQLPADRQNMLRAARSREAAMEGRTVLVVEDDVRNVFALTSLLEPKGVRIEIARNGVEALRKLESLGTGERGGVDLVLMDLMMPEMDGLTAMREIRRRAEWQKLPIIALTAKAMRDDHEQSLAAGANDYIAKPLDVERLLSLVRVWMPK